MKRFRLCFVALLMMLVLSFGLPLCSFAGHVPGHGTTQTDPFMTSNSGGSYSFTEEVNAGTSYYFDPIPTTKYEYEVSPGSPLIGGVQLFTLPFTASVPIDDTYFIDFPGSIGGPFLHGPVGDSTSTITSNPPFDFTAFISPGVSKFTVSGISPAAGVDSLDPLGFVTGLTFTSSGTVTLEMTPTVIPEPSSLVLFSVASLVLLGLIWRHRRQTA